MFTLIIANLRRSLRLDTPWEHISNTAGHELLGCHCNDAPKGGIVEKAIAGKLLEIEESCFEVWM